MATDLPTVGITRTSSSGTFSYAVKGNGNVPVFDVSWGDAARFVNWLANGEPVAPKERLRRRREPIRLTAARAIQRLMLVSQIRAAPGSCRRLMSGTNLHTTLEAVRMQPIGYTPRKATRHQATCCPPREQQRQLCRERHQPPITAQRTRELPDNRSRICPLHQVHTARSTRAAMYGSGTRLHTAA